MCRQIFTAKVVDGIGTKSELGELEALVNCHRQARETEQAEDFEYEET